MLKSLINKEALRERLQDRATELDLGLVPESFVDAGVDFLDELCIKLINKNLERFYREEQLERLDQALSRLADTGSKAVRHADTDEENDH